MKTIEDMRNDYDWREAFYYFPASILDVAEVIASDDGENDERNWLILARLHDGLYIAGRAGCDYTGWDCRANGNGSLHETLEEAIRMGLTAEEQTRLGL